MVKSNEENTQLFNLAGKSLAELKESRKAIDKDKEEAHEAWETTFMLKSKRGVTLIQLLIGIGVAMITCVGIIAVLVALAVVAFG